MCIHPYMIQNCICIFSHSSNAKPVFSYRILLNPQMRHLARNGMKRLKYG